MTTMEGDPGFDAEVEYTLLCDDIRDQLTDKLTATVVQSDGILSLKAGKFQGFDGLLYLVTVRGKAFTNGVTIFNVMAGNNVKESLILNLPSTLSAEEREALLSNPQAGQMFAEARLVLSGTEFSEELTRYALEGLTGE